DGDRGERAHLAHVPEAGNVEHGTPHLRRAPDRLLHGLEPGQGPDEHARAPAGARDVDDQEEQENPESDEEIDPGGIEDAGVEGGGHRLPLCTCLIISTSCIAAAWSSFWTASRWAE